MPKHSKATPQLIARPVAINTNQQDADLDLVNEATSWIRTKLAKTISKGLTDVGEYVFQKFFGGDPDRVRSKDPTKAASFSALVERCESTDLPITRATLYRAVAVAVMLRQLPSGAEAYPRLPPTHQATLLPLRDAPDAVERFAQRALTEKLSVRSLRGEVAQEISRKRRPGERRGRRPAPRIVKTIDGSLRLFTLDNGRRIFAKSQVDELTEAQVKHALKGANDLSASLGDLVAKLRARLP